MNKKEIIKKLLVSNSDVSFVVVASHSAMYEEAIAKLKEKGVNVKVLNLMYPENSARYNPFAYLKNERDIMRLAECFAGTDKQNTDKFYQKSGRYF